MTSDKRIVWAWSLILAASIASNLHAQQYSVNSIPLPAGGWQPFAVPYGINNSGRVVGYDDYYVSGNYFNGYFIGTASGSAPIPLPAGMYVSSFGDLAQGVVSEGINDSGQVTGLVCYDTCRAFIGTAAGITPIPLPAGWSVAVGDSINNSGQVAGWGSNGTTHQAFIGTAAGSTPIPLPAGWSNAYGNGLNNSGQVTGYAFNGGGSTGQAFIGTAAGSTPIPLPAGWSNSWGYGINNSGQVTGWVFQDGVCCAPDMIGTTGQAFIGTAAGSTAIPLPAGWFAALGSGVNNLGQVVGWGSGGGFIWDATNGSRDLNTLVPTGWSIAYAFSINDAGQIAGLGINSSTGFSGIVVLTQCPVAVTVTPGGEAASTFGLPTYMQAKFVPNNGSTLLDYAHACGFTGFDWVQTVTQDLTVGNYAESDQSMPLKAEYPDPPNGGYSWQWDNSVYPPKLLPFWQAWMPNVAKAYPYFYSKFDIPTADGGTGGNGCAVVNGDTCHTRIMSDAYTLNFYDPPSDSTCKPPAPCLGFKAQLVGFCPAPSPACNLPGPAAPLFKWTYSTNWTGNPGGIPGPGGITITSINGVQLPPVASSSQVSTIASGLGYSRVSQTFNGTVTVKNISASAISGPLQIVFFGMPAGVTLVNATGNLSGTPFLTAPAVASLAPGQSVAVSVQFKNPSNAAINITPVIYSGSIN